MNYLTLAEMAARLNKTPKAFSRQILDHQIPYLPAGSNPRSLRGALFVAPVVEAHIAKLCDADVVDALSIPPNERKVLQYVYLIWAINSTRYKIGITYNPIHRLREMNVGSPLDLKLLAAIPSPLLAEKDLHDHFQKYRVKGEWFNFPSPDIPLPLFKQWTADYYFAYVGGQTK